MKISNKFLLALSILFIFLPKTLIFAEHDSKGEFLRNPFLTLDEQEQGYFIKEKGEGISLYLQGIFVWPTKKVALINGQVLKEGDFIEGKRVTSINEDKVILKDNIKTLILKLPSLRESVK